MRFTRRSGSAPAMICYSVMALLALAGCAEAPSGPMVGAVAARAGSDPTVTSVSPVDGPKNITLDLTVNGSGFDVGSMVRLELNGAPAAGVTTNGTTFVSARKLIANITISADAMPDRYDVAVATSTGKRGIGVERFEVLDLLDLGLVAGSQTRSASRINELGHVTGSAVPSDFFWALDGGAEPLTPGYWFFAFGINDADQVTGTTCLAPLPTEPNTPSCAYYGAVLNRTAAGWSVTRITGDRGETRDINNQGQVFGNDPGPTRWSFTGTGYVRESMPVPAARPDAKVYEANNTGQATGTGVLWSFDQGGVTTTLVPVPAGASGATLSELADVNAAGHLIAVGSASVNGYSRPYRWTFARVGGSWQVIRAEALPLPRKPRTVNEGVATGVNRYGDAVGHVVGSLGYDPVLWPAAGGVEVLPHPQGGFSSQAMRINGQGWVAGKIEYTDGNHAVVWRRY